MDDGVWGCFVVPILIIFSQSYYGYNYDSLPGHDILRVVLQKKEEEEKQKQKHHTKNKQNNKNKQKSYLL